LQNGISILSLSTELFQRNVPNTDLAAEQHAERRELGAGRSRCEVVDELRGMMDSLPEEKKSVVRRFVDKVDQM